MKKGIKAIAVVVVILLGFVAYFFIYGGKPHIENFKEYSKDYETIGKIALDYYRDISPDEAYIILDFCDGGLQYQDKMLELTEAQRKSADKAGEKFGYLRVCKDAVFFRVDETGYYGLVYSKNPLVALYKAELPQNGREYHRINNRWYEWGVWGI